MFVRAPVSRATLACLAAYAPGVPAEGPSSTSAPLRARIDSLLTPQRLCVYPVVLIAMFSLVWLVERLSGSTSLLPDFVARWTAGRILASGHAAALYSIREQAAIQSHLGVRGLSWFVSPPHEAVLLRPLGYLGYDVAAVIWSLASIAMLAASFVLFRGAFDKGPRVGWGRSLVLACASQPLLELVGGGQDTAMVLLGFMMAYRALRRERPLLAGIALSVGLVKPQLMVLAPVYFLARREGRVLLGLGMGAATAFVVGLGAGGLPAWVRWGQAVTSPTFQQSVGTGQAWKSTTVWSLATALVPAQLRVAGLVMAGLVAALLVGIALRAWTRRGTELAGLLVSVPLTSVLVAPHAMVYDLVLVIPGCVVLVTTRATPEVRVGVAAAYVVSWLSPTLHTATFRLPWPGSAIGGPWVVVPLLALWCQSVDREERTPYAVRSG